jgi:hypothetical protein
VNEPNKKLVRSHTHNIKKSIGVTCHEFSRRRLACGFCKDFERRVSRGVRGDQLAHKVLQLRMPNKFEGCFCRAASQRGMALSSWRF